KLLDEVIVEEYDALAVPGGYEEFGLYEEAYNKRFLELVREFDRQRIPIAAVCVGAPPLGTSGILDGRRATTYHLKDAYRQKQLAEFGAVVMNEESLLTKI